MSYHVIIPARMASTRLPNKPLANLAGLPMIIRVAQQAHLSQAKQVRVACDDERIMQACQQHNVLANLTVAHHTSGTERLAELVETLGLADDEVVVNVQGDEPFIAPSLIDGVAKALVDSSTAQVSTACHSITDVALWHNPNVVKVLLNAQQEAIYFSRASIPFDRDNKKEQETIPAYRHVGIYAYRVGFLKRYPHLKPCAAEQWESLEQLRVLHHGYKIAVHITHDEVLPGIDTPEDLALAVARLQGTT